MLWGFVFVFMLPIFLVGQISSCLSIESRFSFMAASGMGIHAGILKFQKRVLIFGWKK